MNGLDRPVLPVTPDYVKTLEIEHAMSDEPLIAWEMNGQEIPFLNGYPLKLIVPGYFGTYWIEHLCEIHVLDQPLDALDSFAMNRAYRVPDNECFCVLPGTVPDRTRPITRSGCALLLPVCKMVAGSRLGRKFCLKELLLTGERDQTGRDFKRWGPELENGQS